MKTPTDWTKEAAGESVLPETVAKLISQSINKSFYVIDQPASGSWEIEYSHCPPYFLETAPEQGHYDYDPHDLVKANRVLRKHSKARVQAIIAQLRRINPELATRLPLPFLDTFEDEHWFIMGIVKFVLALAGLAAFAVGAFLVLNVVWSFLSHSGIIVHTAFDRAFDMFVGFLKIPLVDFVRTAIVWLSLTGIVVCLLLKFWRSIHSRRESRQLC